MIAHVEIAGRCVIAALFYGLWQAPLFAAAAWLVLRVRREANATTRHTVFAAALAASLILPVVTAGFTLGQPAKLAGIAGTSDTQSPQRAPLHHPQKRETRIPTRALPDPEMRPATSLSFPSPLRARLELPETLALGIAGVWLAGVLFVLLRLIVSLVHLERLKRDALPFPVKYRAQLARSSTAAKGFREVRLCTSDEIEVPIAVGLFDAMILVPARLLEELEPSDVDSIVLHELAHLRRFDDWINAIERFGHALFFFNPAIGWIVAQLDLEREVACDDWVLQQNDALPYATCLAKIVESTTWPYRAMTAPGAFVTRRGMSVRIERLLAKHRDVRVSTSFGPAGATVAFLAVLGIVAAFVSPSIAYTVAPAPIAPNAPADSAVVQAPPKTPEAIVEHALPREFPHVAVTIARSRPATRLAVNPPIPPRVSPIPRSHKSFVIADATEPDYIDQLAQLGYRNLSIDDLIQLKNLGVSAGFIRGVEREGLTHPSVSDLVKMRALGVDPEYVGSMRRRYGNSLDIDDIVSMKAVGVTPDYIEGLASLGVKNLSPEHVRGLRALGVTPGYVRDLARAGYPNLTLDQLQQLKALGIDSGLIVRAHAHGMRDLTIEQLVKLRATGVI